jgi:hypothetical protein
LVSKSHHSNFGHNTPSTGQLNPRNRILDLELKSVRFPERGNIDYQMEDYLQKDEPIAERGKMLFKTL